MLESEVPLRQTLGISFEEPELLELALTHSSYLNENPDAAGESNERLEFLGDAVLGAVVARELFERNPDWPEGRLTQARAAIVEGKSLAQTARRLGLGTHLHMGKGEEAAGGRDRPSNLAGAFEAVVGAVFVDQGYETAEAFILRMMAAEFENTSRDAVLQNPKSVLQETVQAQGLPAPSYETVDVSGEDHARLFTVEVVVDGEVKGRGTGRRKSQAEQEAAEQALRNIKGCDLWD